MQVQSGGCYWQPVQISSDKIVKANSETFIRDTKKTSANILYDSNWRVINCINSFLDRILYGTAKEEALDCTLNIARLARQCSDEPDPKRKLEYYETALEHHRNLRNMIPRALQYKICPMQAGLPNGNTVTALVIRSDSQTPAELDFNLEFSFHVTFETITQADRCFGSMFPQQLGLVKPDSFSDHGHLQPPETNSVQSTAVSPIQSVGMAPLPEDDRLSYLDAVLQLEGEQLKTAKNEFAQLQRCCVLFGYCKDRDQELTWAAKAVKHYHNFRNMMPEPMQKLFCPINQDNRTIQDKLVAGFSLKAPGLNIFTFKSRFAT